MSLPIPHGITWIFGRVLLEHYMPIRTDPKLRTRTTKKTPKPTDPDTCAAQWRDQRLLFALHGISLYSNVLFCANMVPAVIARYHV